MPCIRKGLLSLVVWMIPMGIASLLLDSLLSFAYTMSRNNNWRQPAMLESTTSSSSSSKSEPGCNHSSCKDDEDEDEDDAMAALKSPFSGLAIVGAFNHQRDVFKNSKVPVNATFEYIQSWYESLQQFPTIQGVVLHNMFTPEQTQAWTTHQIHFVELSNHTSTFKQAKASRRPINDMRFFVLKEFLTRLYAQRNDPAAPLTFRILPDYILFSDSYDVRFLRNPFEYMQQMDNTIRMDNVGGDKGQRQQQQHQEQQEQQQHHQLFVGEEYAYQARKKIWDQWMNKSSTQCFGQSLPPSSRMINCGLVGGHVHVVMELLDKLVATLQSAQPRAVCDQISLYYTLSKHYRDQFISGYPFNSQFNQWESSNDTLAYIAHK